MRAHFGSGWNSTEPIRPAPRATAAWTRWASDWKTSTPSAAGAPRTEANRLIPRADCRAAGRFDGPGELKTALLTRRDAFARCLAEKMLTYALGRGLDRADRRAVDQIVARLARNEYRFSALILAVVGERSISESSSRARQPMSQRGRLSRRTVLRGLGVSVALPFLEAMRPTTLLAASGDSKKPPLRMAFLYVPNGVHMPGWTPQIGGRWRWSCRRSSSRSGRSRTTYSS